MFHIHHLSVLGLLALAACTPMPKSPDTAAAPTSNPAFEIPEQVNHTPFDSILLTGSYGEDRNAGIGEFFSWGTKIAFDMDARGRLTVSERQEASLDASDDPARDFQCGARGGLYNQRSVWFPYTGILVRGGTLESVVDTGIEQRLELIPLSPYEQGMMMVVGEKARQVEYAYVPCVGEHRVSAGARLNSFLPRGARLKVKPTKGASLALSLPDPVEPFMLLRYTMGAMIPVPMRPSLMTIDLIDRRVVVYYQSTFSPTPPLRKVEMRAILPNQEPSEGETPERFRERSEAQLRDLRACAINTRPIEPCATPNRRPDRRIFTP